MQLLMSFSQLQCLDVHKFCKDFDVSHYSLYGVDKTLLCSSLLREEIKKPCIHTIEEKKQRQQPTDTEYIKFQMGEIVIFQSNFSTQQRAKVLTVIKGLASSSSSSCFVVVAVVIIIFYSLVPYSQSGWMHLSSFAYSFLFSLTHPIFILYSLLHSLSHTRFRSNFFGSIVFSTLHVTFMEKPVNMRLMN